jgi:hypothetical protein
MSATGSTHIGASGLRLPTRHRAPAARAIRRVQVLTYINNGVGYDVYSRLWSSTRVGAQMSMGQVSKLGSKWQARLPDGYSFPILFSSRRSAGEALRQANAARRAS